MKYLLKKYSHLKYIVIFTLIYLVYFFLLEAWSDRPYWITDTWIDQYIPFNEYFVIPYVIWYFYIVAGFAYFVFIDVKNFKRTCYYLCTGMILALTFCLIVPNAQTLRVEIMNENIFQYAVGFLYSIDTSTNVFPSIHVYNSVMMCVALLKSEEIKKHKIFCIFLVVLSISICLSTVFIKQHAFIDIPGALVLCLAVYYFGKYKFDY